MPDFLARCPKCGSEVRLFRSEGAAHGAVITVENNTVHCGNCGIAYRTEDGVFTQIGEVFKKVAEADISEDALRALLALLRSSDLTAFDLRAEIKSAAPDISPFLDPYLDVLNNNQLLIFLKVLAVILAGVVAKLGSPIAAAGGAGIAKIAIDEIEKAIQAQSTRRKRNRRKGQRKAGKGKRQSERR